MTLPAPVFQLKRRAKLLARETGAAQHDALDAIARQEGFASWSHLSASTPRGDLARSILSQAHPGDLILLGARPMQKKTRLGLELAIRADEIARQGYFFTLDYTPRDIADQAAAMGLTPSAVADKVVIDTSDGVCADYVIARVAAGREPALVVVDYLQLLDQKRANPSLEDQVVAMRSFARQSGAVCVLISQIDRAFDMAGKSIPNIDDIRLPNPLDLSLFSRFCFLHDGKMSIQDAI